MCASEIDVEDSSCQSEQIWNGVGSGGMKGIRRPENKRERKGE